MEKPGVNVERRFLNYEKAGRYCDCSRWSLYRAVKAGRLRRYGSANSPRFSVEALDTWMEQGASTTPDK